MYSKKEDGYIFRVNPDSVVPAFISQETRFGSDQITGSEIMREKVIKGKSFWQSPSGKQMLHIGPYFKRFNPSLVGMDRISGLSYTQYSARY